MVQRNVVSIQDSSKVQLLVLVASTHHRSDQRLLLWPSLWFMFDCTMKGLLPETTVSLGSDLHCWLFNTLLTVSYTVKWNTWVWRGSVCGECVQGLKYTQFNCRGTAWQMEWWEKDQNCPLEVMPAFWSRSHSSKISTASSLKPHPQYQSISKSILPFSSWVAALTAFGCLP